MLQNRDGLIQAKLNLGDRVLCRVSPFLVCPLLVLADVPSLYEVEARFFLGRRAFDGLLLDQRRSLSQLDALHLAQWTGLTEFRVTHSCPQRRQRQTYCFLKMARAILPVV